MDRKYIFSVVMVGLFPMQVLAVNIQSLDFQMTPEGFSRIELLSFSFNPNIGYLVSVGFSSK